MTEAKIYTRENWAEFIAAKNAGDPRVPGLVLEVDCEIFDYFLEVLPPIYMGRVKEVGDQRRRVSYGFAEGYEPITDFWIENGRYYCQRGTEMNRG